MGRGGRAGLTAVARTALDPEAVRDALAKLPLWTLAPDGRSVARDFAFRDFGEAFAFMTRAALLAEKLDHHPDWSNSYRKVSVRLSTHDAGGLTELDFRLAAAMDRFAAASPQQTPLA